MSESSKTPFVRLAKRTDIDPRRAMLIRIASIVIALILGTIPYDTVTGMIVRNHTNVNGENEKF